MFPPGVSCARLANAPAPASRSRKQGGLGDTNVDIGLAGCRLLGRLQQCLPRSDVSFEFGLAHARGQQHCPQHREHLLSSR